MGRASVGWVEPGLGPLWTLREKYYPGDIGFDPLSFKPKDAEGFVNMQNKELSHGRLAMFAAAGMCVQELEWQRYTRESWHLSRIPKDTWWRIGRPSLRLGY